MVLAVVVVATGNGGGLDVVVVTSMVDKALVMGVAVHLLYS